MHIQVTKSYDNFYFKEKYYFAYIFMSTKNAELNQFSLISKGTIFRVLQAPGALGASGGSRPVTVRVCGSLCARVRCAPDASGVD